MLSLQSLQNVAGGAKALVAAMRKVLDAHNAKVEQFEADKTRSQSYIAENIKAAREAALPAVQKNLTELRETAKNAEAQREFWGSRALLMSRIPFNTDPVADATIRMRYASELAAMDAPLLALTQKNALEEKNLPLVWACSMAARSNNGDSKLLDLSGVEIPGQAAALQLIADCDAALAEGELIEAAMRGSRMDPVRKLTVARRMDPNRPTAHNSPGRPVGA